MAPSAHNIISVLVFSGIGVYTGVKFFEPIIIEQLRKDGNLRSDIEIPEFDKDGNRIIGGLNKTDEPSVKNAFWDELRQKLELPANEKKNIKIDLADLNKTVEEKNSDKKD
ncbi:hypothetical protein CANARDRAFT_29621 [[Candida] arabinofermentans NRRL YB-2248]|uniref:Uncharacterized protein n=1 Tax=[Candida] arabinofermentans NRRL YB-2248 TaxID=983967 RepID=A0A1E4SWR9_9ASCO|nr:hypothetical protein CANARDRAFT_29621 [[Candida] arabinofermentans NRRL YB-2248]